MWRRVVDFTPLLIWRGGGVKDWKAQRYCKNLDIRLVFATYKIKNLFSAKDAIPNYPDPVLFINFLAQAVAPVMSAKQTDVLLHVSVNI